VPDFQRPRSLANLHNEILLINNSPSVVLGK
jgi:hypothetical protein